MEREAREPVGSFLRLGTETAFDVLSRAQKLMSEGKDVVNLGIGQPDKSPPSHVVEAAMRALREGRHGYTEASGILELREEVSRHLTDLYDLEEAVDSSCVMVVPGGKVTMFQAIMMRGEEGGEVLVPNPGFPIYGSLVNFSGAKLVSYRLCPDNNCRPSVEGIEAALSEKTRLLILNNPGNPTGGCLPSDEMDRLGQVLKNYPDVWILSDEIYSRLVFDGISYRSMLSYPWLRDRVIVLDGWSKAYAMTGWRVGMAVWPKDLKVYAERMAINSYSCVNVAAQWGALAALRSSQESVEEMRKDFQERRDVVCEEVSRMEGVRCNVPDGAFYAFLDVGESGLGDADVAQDILLDNYGVAFISGHSFGEGNGSFLRMSFAASKERILEGLSRLSRAIREAN
jgi:aspartate/methionine/tyrosine aminotransferase